MHKLESNIVEQLRKNIAAYERSSLNIYFVITTPIKLTIEGT